MRPQLDDVPSPDSTTLTSSIILAHTPDDNGNGAVLAESQSRRRSERLVSQSQSGQQNSKPDMRQSTNAAQPTSKKTAYPQSLPELAPNVIEVDGQHQALSCAIEGCHTNRHQRTATLFNGLGDLKRHAKTRHTEDYKVAFPEEDFLNGITDVDFLYSSLVNIRTVTQVEIDDITTTGSLPEDLRPRLAQEKFTYVKPQRKRKESGAAGSRKKRKGRSKKTPNIGTEVEQEAEKEETEVVVIRT